MGLDHGLTREVSQAEIDAEFAKVADKIESKAQKQMAKKMIADELREVAVWRKHPNLHGWIENRWRNEGGSGVFNCVDFELDEETIEECIKAVESETLPRTEGFFFGDPEEEWPEDEFQEQKKYDLKVLGEALERVRKGETITYWSWW